MAKMLNKVLNFVGWETDDEIEEEMLEEKEEMEEASYTQHNSFKKAPQSNKVVNIHTSSQFKVVVMQPESFEDAQEVCNHLKSKKPVVVNLESLERESAQRIIDFIGGAIYALDGSIQKVSKDIIIIAPNNVDIAGDFKDELKNKGVFPWMK